MSALPTLFVAGSSNFRDLADQVHPRVPLRPRTLFRSSHLGELDDRDIRQIQDLGVRRVVDFRGERERRGATCAVPGVREYSLAIEPTIIQVLKDLAAVGKHLAPEDVVLHMKDTYRNFVRHNTARFAQFFDLLLESSEPLVFHCTAGKDRTGFAAALVLHALGASQQDIQRDYLVTNERLKAPPGQALGLAPDVASVLWSVQPGFLQAAFDAVIEDYGSLDAYLHDALAMTAPRMRELHRLYLDR